VGLGGLGLGILCVHDVTDSVLDRVCPYLLARGQNALVFPEDTCSLEGHGIIDAASMANSIVHNNERIRECDKLIKGQIVTA